MALLKVLSLGSEELVWREVAVFVGGLSLIFPPEVGFCLEEEEAGECGREEEEEGVSV